MCPPKAPEQPGVEIKREWVEADSNRKSRRGDLDESNSIRRSTKRSFPAHDYPIGDWQEQASLGTSGKSNASAASDVQPPKGLTNDVKVEKCAEGQSAEAGKTPLR